MLSKEGKSDLAEGTQAAWRRQSGLRGPWSPQRQAFPGRPACVAVKTGRSGEQECFRGSGSVRGPWGGPGAGGAIPGAQAHTEVSTVTGGGVWVSELQAGSFHRPRGGPCSSGLCRAGHPGCPRRPLSSPHLQGHVAFLPLSRLLSKSRCPYKAPVIGFRAQPRPAGPHLDLMTSAKTRFPDGVTFMGTGARTST